MEDLSATEAEAIKSEIREAAKGGPGQTAINLEVPENAYSVWFRNASQGFLCKGTGAYRDDAWRLIGKYHLCDSVILDVSAGQDKITVIQCTEG